MSEILITVVPTEERGNLGPYTPKFEPLLNRIDEIAEALKELSLRIGRTLGGINQHEQGSFRVDEIELKLKIDVESGAGLILIAKGTAGLEASLKWKREVV